MVDIQLLKNWVNPQYLSTETIKQVEQAFHTATIPSVQLANFLLPEKAAAVKKAIEKIKLNYEYIPHMHSYHTAAAEKPLADFYAFLNSPGFKTLLGTMLRKEIKTVHPQLVVYEHKDYTLLHDTIEQRAATVLFFDFTKDWNDAAGGKTVFISPNSDPLIFPRMFNAICVAALVTDVHYFLKYVNGVAGKNKVYLVKVECD